MLWASQHLLPNVLEEEKRVLAPEVMFSNSAIAASIRFNKLDSIDTVYPAPVVPTDGTLDESIKQLLREGRIDRKQPSGS